MVGRDIGKCIARDCAGRCAVDRDIGDLVACCRCDRKGLVCSGVHRDRAEGEMEPFEPAVDVIVYVFAVKVAEIVWLAVTLENV